MNNKTLHEVVEWIRNHEMKTVILSGTDTNGSLKGKFMDAETFVQIIEKQSGIHMSNVFFVVNPLEEKAIEPPEGYTGYFPTRLNGFPDIMLTPDISTFRPVPWLEKTALVLGDFALHDGNPVPISPRQVLKKVLERAKAKGLDPYMAFEYEFYIVPETAQSLKQKYFTNIQPLTARSYTYDIYRGALDEEIIAPLRESMKQFGIGIEASHTETGPGQYELNLQYGPALEAADNVVLYKSGVKQYAAQRGYTATFMAKPQAHWAGNSCHAHVSLWQDGKNVFWSEKERRESDTLRHFSGGMLRTMREFTALFAPTINSYKRYVPYSWASTTVSWGMDNRSTGLRLVLDGPNKTRVEHRLGGGDINPYLLAAALLAGGLYGIEQQIEPDPLFQGDAYDAPDLETVPTTLDEAIRLFNESDVAREYLGENFVNYYVLMKSEEVNEAKTAVTDWEVKRYFELF